MSRRKKDQQDSLEMLLDTMCNAFGGIILIAILIALLVRETDVASDPDPGILRLENERDLLAQNAATKKTEAKEKAAKVDKIDPGITNLVNKLKGVTNEVTNTSGLVVKLKNAPEEIKKTNIDIADITAGIAKMISNISGAEKERDKWKVAAGDAKDGKGIKIRPPRVASVTKEPTIFIVEGGEFWTLNRFEKGKKVLNELTTKVTRTGGVPSKQEIIPAKGIDFPVNLKQFPVAGRLASVIRTVPKAKYYCHIMIHKNSFDEGAALIEHLVKNNIGYNWEPRNKIPVFGFSTKGINPGTQGTK